MMNTWLDLLMRLQVQELSDKRHNGLHKKKEWLRHKVITNSKVKTIVIHIIDNGGLHYLK